MLVDVAIVITIMNLLLGVFLIFRDRPLRGRPKPAGDEMIEKHAELPKELTLLIGEPETLSYDAVQRLVGQLLHAEEWETREIPKPLAKTGAWLENEVLDEEPFIKPWHDMETPGFPHCGEDATATRDSPCPFERTSGPARMPARSVSPRL